MQSSNNKLQLEGIIIECRNSDGYVNATALCLAGGRRFKRYMELKSTKELLAGYAKIKGRENRPLNNIENKELIIKENNGDGDIITWVHRDIAMDIAQWISVEFRIQVLHWIVELLEKGRVEAIEESKQYIDQLKKVDHIVKSDEKRSRQKLTPEEVKDVCYQIRILNTPVKDLQVYKDGKVKLSNLYCIKNYKIYKDLYLKPTEQEVRLEGTN